MLPRLGTLDASADCWATEPVQTLKTFKTPRNHVKAEATEHHPAQVDVYQKTGFKTPSF
ncbi:DUF7873 family protein [Microcoleus vaginatus]|uniref:DUF7873 family protein n=1 Tax=Microcoleus vaginatus TaxID=119532 RepID=UPI0040409A9F